MNGTAGARGGPRIAFIMRRHPAERPSPIMPEIIRSLIEQGQEVQAIYPEERTIDLATLRVEHDLYVLKSGTDVALSLAGALDALGASILNPYAVATRCRDKVIATRVMQHAGVPCPATFLTSHPARLAPLLDDGPLVVKPHRGTGGRDVRVVRGIGDLGDLPIAEDLVFAQRFHEPAGPDRKIYRIGGEMFGVKRVWPARTLEDKLGEPFEPGPEEREIMLRCGDAFGMRLYGLDVVTSDGRPYVVDISSFPGFKGVPEAALRLAGFIQETALRVANGGPVVPETGSDSARIDMGARA